MKLWVEEDPLCIVIPGGGEAYYYLKKIRATWLSSLLRQRSMSEHKREGRSMTHKPFSYTPKGVAKEALQRFNNHRAPMRTRARYAAIITLAWSCGLRPREVYLAKIGDINQIPPAHPHDPDGKYLLVNKSHLETGDHYIPIDPTAMRFLECWLGFHPFADNPKAYLFCSKDGKAINGANTRIDITSLRREAIKYGKHGSLTHAAHLSEQSYLREHRGEVIPESHWWKFPRMLPDLSNKVQKQLNHKTQ